MTESNLIAATNGPPIPTGSFRDVLYSPMLTRKKFGKEVPKSRRWIQFALGASIMYTGYYYLGGINKMSALSTKVTSTFVSLIFAISIQIIMTCKNRK